MGTSDGESSLTYQMRSWLAWSAPAGSLRDSGHMQKRADGA